MKKIISIVFRSNIEIYNHDHSRSGIVKLVSIEASDSYPNPQLGFEAIRDHHFSMVDALKMQGEYLGRPFVLSSGIIPGETCHLSATLEMITLDDDATPDSIYLAGWDDADSGSNSVASKLRYAERLVDDFRRSRIPTDVY